MMINRSDIRVGDTITVHREDKGLKRTTTGVVKTITESESIKGEEDFIYNTFTDFGDLKFELIDRPDPMPTADVIQVTKYHDYNLTEPVYTLKNSYGNYVASDGEVFPLASITEWKDIV